MQALQIVMAVLVMVFMLGLGATMSPADCRRAVRVWQAPLTAFLCQYVLMPPIAVGLALAMDVPKSVGLSMLVVGCAPGGSTSNLFCYYAQGDLALSIFATVLSTTLSLGLMPLCLFAYSGPFTDENLSIPYGNIIASLAIVIAPVGLGILLKHLSESGADRVEKLTSIMGIVFILVVLVLFLLQDGLEGWPKLAGSNWKIWLASALLMPVGSALGYLIARFAARLPEPACRTICLETGLQNITLSLAVLAFTFEEAALFEEAAVFPLIYGLFCIVDGSFLAMLFYFLNLRDQQRSAEKDDREGAVSKACEVVDNSKLPEDTNATPQAQIQGSSL